MDIKANSDFALKEFYLGSRKFQFVADAVGLPIDQVNFIFGQILALMVAYLFRVVLHPQNVSSASRHWTAMSAGLCISYFCFGKQVLLAVLLVVMCYFLLNLLPPTIFHHATLIASITFLSAVHIQRQFYEDGLFVVDITGPLMIMVQKVTSLAYSLNDGLVKDSAKLTSLQKKYVIWSKPSALEYFSYLLCFQSILAGPFFMFTEYQDFIAGTHYLRYESLKKPHMISSSQESTNNNRARSRNIGSSTLTYNDDKEELCTENLCHSDDFEEPNPSDAALRKIFFATLCALSVIFILPKFPIKRLADPTFYSASMTYKITYIIMTTTLARQLYYTAWFLADAVCTTSGLGFNGYDTSGKSKWDLVSNINFSGVEFGTSLKITLESWNVGTMKWLRFLVYERAARQKTILTYLLSSLWHGFYPGYYLTFSGGAFFTIISRIIRRSIRPRVLKFSAGVKVFYDFVTFIATRLCLSYITFPFVLLRFWPSIYTYNSLRYYLHILGIITVCTLPVVLPPLKESKQPSVVEGKSVSDFVRPSFSEQTRENSETKVEKCI